MMWKIVVFTVLASVFGVGLGGLVGGFRTLDVNDEGVQNAANFATVEYNRESNDAYLSHAEVVKAEVQVVSGMKYVLTVNMTRTTCKKNSANEVCEAHTDPAMARSFQCKFTVWHRAWLSDIRVLKKEC